MSKIRRKKRFIDNAPELFKEVEKGPMQLTPQRKELDQPNHPGNQTTLSTEEFRSQCAQRIAQALVSKLGIQNGQVTYAKPRTTTTDTGTKYATEMYIKSDKPNSGIIVYVGPFDELYDAALMLALLEVEEQTLDFSNQK